MLDWKSTVGKNVFSDVNNSKQDNIAAFSMLILIPISTAEFLC